MHFPSPEDARLAADRFDGPPDPRAVAGDVLPATPGDQPEALALLMQTLQSSVSEDLQSRLDEPGHSWADRLLLRRRGQLIGHVRACRRIAWFAGERIPVARFDDLAVLPEYAANGSSDALLAAAEESAACEGALVLTALAADPRPFLQRGWSRVRGQGHTRARTRAVLAHLDALQQHRRRRRRAEPSVRTWRLVDLDAVEQFFAQLAPHGWGVLLRSPEAWRWLAGRKVHDAILLAVSPRTTGYVPALAEAPQSELAAANEQLVGYAVLRDSEVIEMYVDPDCPAASTALLTRACRDAIDRGHHYISLHTPADDPLHELIVTAGGNWASQPAHGLWLARLIAPDRWVERLYSVLRERAVAADIDRPAEIIFRVDERLIALVLTRRSARLEQRAGDDGDAIACSAATLQDLLLGNLSLARAQREQLLPPLDDERARLVRGLLPPRQLWQSPWEVLRLPS